MKYISCDDVTAVSDEVRLWLVVVSLVHCVILEQLIHSAYFCVLDVFLPWNCHKRGTEPPSEARHQRTTTGKWFADCLYTTMYDGLIVAFQCCISSRTDVYPHTLFVEYGMPSSHVQFMACFTTYFCFFMWIRYSCIIIYSL